MAQSDSTPTEVPPEFPPDLKSPPLTDQMNSRREAGQGAVCRMACLRRKKREDNVSKAPADIDGVETVHNVEKTVEMNKNEVEKNEVKPNESKWNPLDGYYFYYVKGVDKCVRHTEGMNSYEKLPTDNLETDSAAEEYEIDLGEKLEMTKSETTRIIKRAFTPGYHLTKRYIESFTDGTQAAFFRKFTESVQRLDAVHLVGDNAKKAWDVWFGGEGNGEGGVENNDGEKGKKDKNAKNDNRGDDEKG
ncbi:3042_t:CDS:2 [Paraglomus occultum]|uniref:3042_t:CDS:1 n=1 Tax=Paraglomus occultum TaxID=144539 RepID=A0A9N9EVW8_9GLOM|nr:3042_t:CDS:2 [Paraglomus occultum]